MGRHSDIPLLDREFGIGFSALGQFQDLRRGQARHEHRDGQEVGCIGRAQTQLGPKGDRVELRDKPTQADDFGYFC